MTQCDSIPGRSRVVQRLHVLVCRECRGAKAADAAIHRGVSRLACEQPSPGGLARALATFHVVAVPRPPRSQRWKSLAALRFMPAGTITAVAALGTAAWLNHIDAPAHIAIPTPVSPPINAFSILSEATGVAPAADRKTDGSLNANRVTAALKAEPATGPVAAVRPISRHVDGGVTGGPGPLPAHAGAVSGFGAAGMQAAPQSSVPASFATPGARETLVREYQPALQRVRRSLRYPYQPPPVRSIATSLPYLADYVVLSKVLELEARIEAEHGDVGAAASSGLDGVELGAMVGHGSTIMDKAVALSCEQQGRAAQWPLVGRLSAPQARAAARRLERVIRLQVPLADTLREDRSASLAGLEETFQARDWRLQFCGYSWPTGAGTYLALLPYSKRRILDDMARVYDRDIAFEQTPYDPHATSDEHEPEASRDPVVALLYPSFGLRFRELFSAQTENALLVASLALRAYELEHNGPPARLEALVPAYLSSVPTDPFGKGRPLGYRLTRDTRAVIDSLRRSRAVLYSVGPDGKDDGGTPVHDIGAPADPQIPVPARYRPRYAVNPFSTGDIVAQVNGD